MRPKLEVINDPRAVEGGVLNDKDREYFDSLIGTDKVRILDDGKGKKSMLLYYASATVNGKPQGFFAEVDLRLGIAICEIPDRTELTPSFVTWAREKTGWQPKP